MAYSGSFTPKNISKYRGDAAKITYRSLWELKLMQWLDLNPDVIIWNSEETVVNYKCKTDNKMHRYFVDFTVQFKSGKVVMIEVKPKSQTKPPRSNGKQSPKFLQEAITYAKNHSKWIAAREYAMKRGWEFQVWTEESLESIGIKIIGSRKKKK